MIRLYLSMIAGALCLSACATTAATERAPATAQPEAVATDAGGLGAQDLANGECGLFLWTLPEPRKLVFFAQAGSGVAVGMPGEVEVNYTQTGSTGDIFGQFTTDMTYSADTGGETLRVSIQPGDLLEEGQRTAAASLTLENADGWETIIPVRGVRACRGG